MGGIPGLTGGRRLTAVALFVGAALALGGCGSVQDDMPGNSGAVPVRPAPASGPSGLHSISFSDLPGWTADDQGPALQAFKQSCERVLKFGSSAPLDEKTGSGGIYGEAGDWQPACRAALDTPLASARTYFERWFTPVRFPSETRSNALFTGYYEPVMHGSLTRHGAFQTPILAPPPGFAAARKAGVIFPSRAEIEAGDYDRSDQPIVWLDNPVDAFFLHVQGSGRVTLENGQTIRLAFAGKNGRPYTSIGKVLIDRGAIAREDVSMQTIRAWLEAHPDQAKSVMDMNESYIFFRRLDGVSADTGPVGAGRVHLTPGRSIAVDRSYHPLGSLFYLATTYPTPGGDRPLDHLMVAQDTGSAILGLQRADVFIGSGDKAGWIAGHMKSHGELFALVPRSLAP